VPVDEAKVGNFPETFKPEAESKRLILEIGLFQKVQ